MTEATNTKLMDTEPGGENTQYESQSTFLSQAPKQSGQLGGTSSSSNATPPESVEEAKTDGEKTARGEKTAENIRFGQNVSESGMGGMTVGMGGGTEKEDGDGGEDAGESKAGRSEMGYGEGNDVGA